MVAGQGRDAHVPLERGAKWQTHSLTEMHVGNAIPFSYFFFLKTFWHCASTTVLPKAQISLIFAPGLHCMMMPFKELFTTSAAILYFVHTSSVVAETTQDRLEEICTAM